jgi:hypothetical protein
MVLVRLLQIGAKDLTVGASMGRIKGIQRNKEPP